MRFVSTRPLAWAGVMTAVMLTVLVALGLTLPAYWVYLLSASAIGALIVRGIGLVTRQTGIILLCQMSFAAIGGWVVSWLSLNVPALPYAALVVIGGLAAVPFGALLGVVTLRIRGVELAVVMLGFAAALDLVLMRNGFPGTSTGTAVIAEGFLSDPFVFLLFAWGLFFIVNGLFSVTSRSRMGLGWAALRSSERAAASLGVHRGLAKSSALAFGALAAGLGGGLLAGQYGLLSGEVFSPLTSLVHLAIAVMFGASFLSGAVLAGLLSVFMPEVLRRLGIPLDVGNALFAIGAIDVLRRGHGGIAEQLATKLETKAFADTLTEASISATPLTVAPVPSTATRHALEVRDITVVFGEVTALESVSFDLVAGEVHALIGPNGAGKSTLIDAVTGFIPVVSGEVHLDGVAIDRLTARERARAGLRRTFQRSRVIDTISVDDYLLLASSGNRELIPVVREVFGLPEGTLPVRLMDLGSRRLLEIAGALVAKPRALLLDEPAAGLGDDQSEALSTIIREIPKQFNTGIVLVEHDMRFIRAAAHRVTVLEKGRLLRSGETAEVLKDPAVISAYLGEEAHP